MENVEYFLCKRTKDNEVAFFVSMDPDTFRAHTTKSYDKRTKLDFYQGKWLVERLPEGWTLLGDFPGDLRSLGKNNG